MNSSNFHQSQQSDWSMPSLPVISSKNTHISTVNQPNAKSNSSCKLLKCWSSMHPVVRGLILGALTNCVVLAIILPIWLVKPSTSITTTSSAPSRTAVLRWNTSGITVAGITGFSGTASNQLSTPWDLILDWSNTLYVTDRYNHRVQKFLMGVKNGTTLAGQMNGTSGLATNQFNQPTGIYIDSSGTLFISDAVNSRVKRWRSGATTGETIIGNGTAGSANNLLLYPYGIWLDENSGTLYIADSYNHRIMRYPSNAQSGDIIAGGTGSGIATSQLSFPYAFHFDSLTNSLLIANAGANNIVRWPIGASNWTLIAGNINGASGNTATSLMAPTDVTLDPMGNIYVVDMQNHRIQFFSSGQSSGVTIAGVSGSFGTASTLLNQPSSLVLDSQLNLYVVDQSNNRIQKFLRY